MFAPDHQNIYIPGDQWETVLLHLGWRFVDGHLVTEGQDLSAHPCETDVEGESLFDWERRLAELVG